MSTIKPALVVEVSPTVTTEYTMSHELADLIKNLVEVTYLMDGGRRYPKLTISRALKMLSPYCKAVQEVKTKTRPTEKDLKGWKATVEIVDTL